MCCWASEPKIFFFVLYIGLPKGPFRTENAIAVKIVVFFFSTAVVFYCPCRFAATFPMKSSIRITIAVANCHRRSDLLRVVFLVPVDACCARRRAWTPIQRGESRCLCLAPSSQSVQGVCCCSVGTCRGMGATSNGRSGCAPKLNSTELSQPVKLRGL